MTNERSAPLSKNVMKTPDACQEFNIQHVVAFSMLRSLGVVFHGATELSPGNSNGLLTKSSSGKCQIPLIAKMWIPT